VLEDFLGGGTVVVGGGGVGEADGLVLVNDEGGGVCGFAFFEPA